MAEPNAFRTNIMNDYNDGESHMAEGLLKTILFGMAFKGGDRFWVYPVRPLLILYGSLEKKE